MALAYALFMVACVTVADDAPLAKPSTESAPPAQADPNDVRDLPLIEVKREVTGTDKLGILISGDGGWWTLDNGVSEVLAAHGVPVIGVSSHKYFAVARTPDSTAGDIARALRHYLSAWKKERVVLMGYSLGADIIPFAAARLPEDLRARVAAIVMIGPSKETMFEFHTMDWVRTPSDRQMYPVQPEIEKLYTGAKLICTTSDADPDCICSKLDPSKVTVIARKGGHHYGGDFKGLGEAIWDALKDVK
ncbi:MAG: cutinase family protein [Candidatus Hydrogenedentes bacterium]|nr:cutinase family protein [Candidatus Hydrogenedentota bacterium]